MYLNFYQLNSKPFQITTDPRFLWLGEKHSEALATLKYGILEDKGFLLLTGDVGTGKTALIKLLVKSIDISAIVATIPDPGLDAADFFNILADEFKMDRRFASKGDFLIYFKQFLLKAHTSDKKVLLIIDEAQRLHHDLLEQIRLLSNIELESRKLINIFFVGQTEFNRTLLEERNKAVRQRITVHYHIEPLAEPETQQYIRHRLSVAGCKSEIFTLDAMRRIHVFSAGYPRLINIVCDHALLTGYSGGTKAIDVNLIRDCEKELRRRPATSGRRKRGQVHLQPCHGSPGPRTQPPDPHRTGVYAAGGICRPDVLPVPVGKTAALGLRRHCPTDVQGSRRKAAIGRPEGRTHGRAIPRTICGGLAAESRGGGWRGAGGRLPEDPCNEPIRTGQDHHLLPLQLE
jgi:type II secretory pathway predicted ATPase ExeA